MPAHITEPLPSGYKLGEYIIDRKISGGGFSLVYLAFDRQGQPVAIKEYLPGGVVKRGDRGTVQPISQDKEGSFRFGMKCFFEEGRALATIRHPNVIRVVNFFRSNDTVYMVMRYERGQTLQRHITTVGEAMREGFIRHVFVQLLNGLREVHTHRILHLDIKPSNIFIRTDGTPVLIDFGAARRTLTQELQHVSPMYTPGFAAPEMYNARDHLGPWTDIYAVGASMYACLSRNPPPPADKRLQKDALVPAVQAFAGKYSKALLELVDSMLQISYTDRPQSVFSVQKRLVNLINKTHKDKPSLLNLIRERLTPT